MSAENKKWVNGAGPRKSKPVLQLLSDVLHEHGMFIEKCGVIGGDERQSVLWAMCSRHRADVDVEWLALGEKFGWVLSNDNLDAVAAAAREAIARLQAARPVEDNRRSPEEQSKQIAEVAKAQQEHSAKESEKVAAFFSLYGEPGSGPVVVEPGKMAVVIRLCHDNSDIMSDYFDRHSSLSPEMVLAVVPAGAQKEAVARSAVARYPEFSGVKFEWHVEQYSMGHGCYLESKGHELPDSLKAWVNQYRGGPVSHGHWEVQFHKAYDKPVSLAPVKGYPGKAASAPKEVPSEAGSMPVPAENSSGIKVSINEEKNGVEIRFPAKPPAEVLNNLKGHGWRWSRFNSCWYQRRSPEAEAFANGIAGLVAA